jgi:undecaprenyl diphosphate synthase
LENQFNEKIKKTAERLGIASNQVPGHIAIIMDGNGRWAQKKGLPRAEGHRQGGKVVEKIAQHSVDLGIKCLTLYSFSMENWKRPKAEVDALMHLYTQYLVGIRSMLMRNNVRLVHLGRANELPKEVQDALNKSIEFTSGNKGMVLAIALNYGGRTEIIDATRKIAQEYKDGELKLEDINEECINNHLYTSKLEDPDLLIRTASEFRVSNFLLWQISYSEFHVTDKLWPDFGKEDIEKAIVAYAARDRRFGSVETQAGNK